MRLVVTLTRTGEFGSALKRVFNNTINYRTTPDGELDILDEEDVTISTFNKDKWEQVSREKEDDEEWPEWVKEPEQNTEQTSGLPELDIPGLDKQLIERGISWRGRGG